MALHDHFRPPLFPDWDWHGFHNGWASNIAAALNEVLPPRYHAQPNVQFGIEIDVATIETRGGLSDDPGARTSESATWAAPAPTLTVPFPILSDVVEVLVRGGPGGPSVVGAIELVSPANKDRPSHRDAFVTKCQAFIQNGVGLVMVDITTERTANLHHALLTRLSPASRSTLNATSTQAPTARSSGAASRGWTCGKRRYGSGGPSRRCRCGCVATCACRLT